MSTQTPSPLALRGVIFDCDGVILDSRTANERYYNMVLEALGLPPLTPEQEAYTYMATVHQSLDYITPPHLRPLLPEVCRSAVNYQRDILPLIQLEKGLVEFLDWLRARDILLAVHTNRFNGMPAILDKFNLHAYFNPVVTAAMVKPKPAPDGVHYVLDQWGVAAQEALFVGDSLNDAQTARSGGVPFAAYRNPALDAAVKVDTFKELACLLGGGSFTPGCRARA